MAASEVSICSNALLMLGDNPINSFTEASPRARLAANLWDSVRDAVLRAHPWNCAVKRAVLAPDAETPAFDWDFQFELPHDCLRILSVGLRGQESSWLVESGKLLCNDNPVALRYIWKNKNPARWDSLLVQAMTVAMRAVFAQPTTGSTSLEQLVQAELKDLIRQARATDGQEEPPQMMGDERLMSARLGLRGYSGGTSWPDGFTAPDGTPITA